MIKVTLSIILINYNSLSDTLECIKSIQNSEIDMLIVVVENGSSDKDVIRETLRGFPQVKVIKCETNIGFGRANNKAISWVQENVICDYIFLLNNDTIVDRKCLGHLSSTMDQAPASVVMATPKILVHARPDEVWYGGGKFDYAKMTPQVCNDTEAASGITLFASGCSMFFRSSELYALAGFDPFFFMYDEDVELSMRIQRERRQILYCPNALVYHKCQGSQSNKENAQSNQLHPFHPTLAFYLRNTILNRRYIINKYFEGSEKKVLLLKQNTYWILKAFQFIFYQNFKAASTVIQQLFITLPTFMK
jgi:GT2 family glycosyltransferase